MKNLEVEQSTNAVVVPKSPLQLFGGSLFSTWLAIGLALTIVFVLSDWIVLNHVRPGYLVLLGLLCSSVWMLASPVISSFAKLERINRDVGISTFVFHVAVALVFALSCTFGFAILMWLTDRLILQTPSTFWPTFQSSTFFFLLANSIFYGFVVVSQKLVEQSSLVHQLRLSESKMQQQLTAARMDVLQIQMQPHFLFNSLNSVSGLIRINEDEKALRAIEKLGNVLRTTLAQNDDPFATLETELEVLETYLELEQVRFGDRLSFSTSIDESVLALPIPRWTLQPLIENAIIHGIEAKHDAGKIHLEAHTEDGKLLITVFDDGVGLKDRNPDGLGIGSTRRRLKEIYGDRAKLTLSSAERGTNVTLAIPMEADNR